MRGAGVTVLSQGSGLAIQLVATVVLARLLTPADFGVVAMVTAFSLLLMNLGLNGFTEAIVQSDAIDHTLASNLFWINIAVGLLLTIVFAASGSLMARFYRNPLVSDVAEAISLTIIFTSASVLHLALLKRAMRFSAVSANDIVARTLSVIVSIALAWAGWGYWALVAGTVAQPLSTAVGAWALCRWTPGFPRRTEGTGAMVRFAANVYGRFGFRYFARNTDKLLVGWQFNASALGFYKKAYDLFALPMGQLISPLTVVAVAALSRLRRDPIQFKRYLINALGIVAFAGMAVGADLTLVGRDLIRLVLGPGWGEAGKIFVFFGPGIGLMLLHGTHGWIHLAIGRADRWLRWTVAEFAVMILLLIIALHWGPAAIAVAWTMSFCILTAPALWYAGRPINLGVLPVLAAVWRYVVAALLAGLACEVLISKLLSSAAPIGAAEAMVRVAAVSLLFIVLYLGAVIMLCGGCSSIYQFGRLLKEMTPWSKPSGLRPAHTLE